MNTTKYSWSFRENLCKLRVKAVEADLYQKWPTSLRDFKIKKKWERLPLRATAVWTVQRGASVDHRACAVSWEWSWWLPSKWSHSASAGFLHWSWSDYAQTRKDLGAACLLSKVRNEARWHPWLGFTCWQEHLSRKWPEGFQFNKYLMRKRMNKWRDSQPSLKAIGGMPEPGWPCICEVF